MASDPVIHLESVSNITTDLRNTRSPPEIQTGYHRINTVERYRFTNVSSEKWGWLNN